MTLNAQQKREWYHSVFALDPKLSTWTGSETTVVTNTVKHEATRGWMVKDRIGILKGFSETNPKFQDLCDAIVKKLPSRPHSDPDLALMDEKEYFYDHRPDEETEARTVDHGFKLAGETGISADAAVSMQQQLMAHGAAMGAGSSSSSTGGPTRALGAGSARLTILPGAPKPKQQPKPVDGVWLASYKGLHAATSRVVKAGQAKLGDAHRLRLRLKERAEQSADPVTIAYVAKLDQVYELFEKRLNESLSELAKRPPVPADEAESDLHWPSLQGVKEQQELHSKSFARSLVPMQQHDAL